MFFALLNLILGFIILSWSADKLVSGSCAIANHLGVAPLIVGLTIVALGTTLPEIFVSVLASLGDNAELAVGNVVGSNIANIGLILGISALIHPLTIDNSTIRLELPIMLLITIGISVLIWFFGLSLVPGLIMATAAIVYLVWLVARGKAQSQEDTSTLLKEFEQEYNPKIPLKFAIVWTALGLILLPLSAQMLINGAVFIATALGISQVVIGITLVAIGTSLPELAASISATFKKEYGIAIGNVIGSNIFNLTAALCAPAIIGTNRPLPTQLFKQDIAVMIFISVLFFFFAFRVRKKQSLGRLPAVLFLLIYIGYLTFVGLTSIQNQPAYQ